MDKRAIIVIGILLASCTLSKNRIDASKIDNLVNITNAIVYEKAIGSTDKSPDHNIELANTIYPNKKGFQLATPKMFEQAEGSFIREVSYYYVRKDSSIKVIFYQWDNQDPDYENLKYTRNKSKRFKNKWNQLVEQLIEQLGEPYYMNVESAKFEDKIIVDESTEESIWSIDDSSDKMNTTWRDDVKWKNSKGINAYMFMFGDNRTGYRQIRLAIYRD